MRKQLKDWIAANCKPASSSSASGSSASASNSSSKQDRHDAFEFLVVHVVLPGTVAASQPRLSGSSSSATTSPDGSVSKRTSTWMKSSNTIMEKVRNDIATSTSKKSNISRLVQIRLSEPAPAAGPTGSSSTALPSAAEKETDYSNLINHMKSLILTAFDTRVQQYEDDIIAKSNQQHLPGWNFCTFFLLKEGLAGAFESVGLLEDAGAIYQELAVAGEMVVRGEEQGREGGETFLGWSGEAVKSLIAEGRRWNKHHKKRGDSQENGTSEEFVPDEESSILTSTRKPYRELILSSNISVFDFLCYVFSRQTALLLNLATILPMDVPPTHPSTAAASFTFMDATATADELTAAGLSGKEGLPGYLTTIVKRGAEFLRLAAAVLREELWAAWDSIQTDSPQKMNSFEGGKENRYSGSFVDDRIPKEYAHILINNVVSSFIMTGTLNILNATDHPSIPPLSADLMVGESPLSPPPTPSNTETFGENAKRVPDAIPSRRIKSTTIYSDTGRGLGIAKDDAPKADVEDLAGVRAEAVNLAKGIILELAGAKWKWNQDHINNEMPTQDEDGLVEIDLDADGDAEKSKDKSIEKDDWLWMWGIRNRALRHALESEEGFLQVFERMSENGLKLCTMASRKKSAERILADLATLRFRAEDYTTAARYFEELTPFYTSQGWSLIESSLLSIFAVCLKKMNRYDDYSAVVVQLLRKHAGEEKQRLNAIHKSSKPAYLQQQFYGTAEDVDDAAPPLSPTKTSHDGSATLLSILKELSEKITPVELSMDSLWTDILVDPYPIYTDDGAGWRARIKWRWLLNQEILLANGKLVFAVLDGKGSSGGKKEIVLHSPGDVVVRKGQGGTWFTNNTILPSRYQPVSLQLSINNITFTHRFPDAHPNILVYHIPSSPSTMLHLPKTISLDQRRYCEVSVHPGKFSVPEAELRIKSLTAGLRVLIGESWIIENGESKEQKGEHNSIDMESVGEGILVIKPSDGETISDCRLGLPYKSDGDLNDLSLQLELTYKSAKGTFTYLATPSIPVSLPLAVNVQDVFKSHA